MGRPKVNHEQMPARFPAGTFERIDAVLDGQTRTAFVQEAVEREIRRRAKLRKTEAQAKPQS